MKNKKGKGKSNTPNKPRQGPPPGSNTSEGNSLDGEVNNTSGKKSENNDKNRYDETTKTVTSQQKSKVSKISANEDDSVARKRRPRQKEESQEVDLSENNSGIESASSTVISETCQDGTIFRTNSQNPGSLPETETATRVSILKRPLQASSLGGEQRRDETNTTSKQSTGSGAQVQSGQGRKGSTESKAVSQSPPIDITPSEHSNEVEEDESVLSEIAYLKEVVVCGMCRQVYADPRKLLCSHTFCSECLLKGRMPKHYGCPQCHVESSTKEVKLDVEKQAIVEVYENYVELLHCFNEASVNGSESHNKQEVTCDMCQIRHKPVKSSCVECNQKMCHLCEIAHNGISICKQHTVRPIDFDICEAQTELRSIVDQLQDRKMQVDTLFSIIQDYIDKLKEVREKNLKSITQVFETLTGSIKVDHLALFVKMRNAHNKLLLNIQTTELMISNDIGSLTSLVTIFGLIGNQNDLSLLTYANKNAHRIFKSSKNFNIEAIQEAINQYPVEHCKLSIGKSIDLQKYACVVLSPGFTDDYKDLYQQQENGNVMICGLLVDLLNCKYDKVNSKTLMYTPKRMSLMKQRLICLTEGAILVYNDTTLIQSIKNKYARNVTGLAQLESGKMVLACNNDNGIRVLEWARGFLVEEIPTGSFSDVCTQKDIIYGLDYCQKKLFWFEYIDKKWEVIGRLALSYGNPNSEDRLLVNDTGVYISSFCNQSIFWLPSVDDSCLGFTVIASTRDHRILNSLYLCDVDDTGKILLAGKDSLKVFEKSTNTCRDVVLPGLSCPPIDAVVTEDGSSVFILTKDSNQLLKYDRFQ